MTRFFLIITLLFSANGCHADNNMSGSKKSLSVSFSIYNYSNKTIENVTVESQGSSSANAATKIGSVGSSGIVCCIDIPLKSNVKVNYSVENNGHIEQKTINVSTENSLEKNNSYAVLHFLPNEKAVLEFSMRPPSPRKDLLINSINKKESEIQFDNESMWNSKTENEMAHLEFPD